MQVRGMFRWPVIWEENDLHSFADSPHHFSFDLQHRARDEGESGCSTQHNMYVHLRIPTCCELRTGSE